MFPAPVRELAERVVAYGAEHGVTVGTAESCTGGLVAGAVTAVPGSSEVILGGIVSYSPLVKHSVLGVSLEVIDGPGVVSTECAEQMALGACRVLGVDVAVGITGIAGPSGAEPGKPVGTVIFGRAACGSAITAAQHFDGDREGVRMQAVRFALELMYEGMMEVSGGV